MTFILGCALADSSRASSRRFSSSYAPRTMNQKCKLFLLLNRFVQASANMATTRDRAGLARPLPTVPTLRRHCSALRLKTPASPGPVARRPSRLRCSDSSRKIIYVQFATSLCVVVVSLLWNCPGRVELKLSCQSLLVRSGGGGSRVDFLDFDADVLTQSRIERSVASQTPSSGRDFVQPRACLLSPASRGNVRQGKAPSAAVPC